mgnify:FL=1
MAVYFEPIKTALILFPIIAFFITLPYLIIEYHKYGAVPLLRSVIVYTFILYLLAAFLLVILPLPSKEAVLKMPTKSPQLVPFTFIKDIMVTTNLNLKNPSTYLSFLKTPTVYTVIFNLFLLFPFGVYLHYYFEKKWYQVLIMSFCLSLFFEITQLTGIFFIYPKAYRLFDVDDLMINTLGGMLGFICTKPLTIFLPSRKELDQKAYTKGTKISIYRRGIALFIDLFLVFCFSTPIWVLFGNKVSFGTFYSITLFLYEVLFPLLDNGRTIGKRFVNLRLKCINESASFPIRLIFRQVILYLFILRIPSYLSYLSKVHLGNNGLEFLMIFGKLLMISYYIYFIYELFLNILGRRKNFNYELVSSVINSSLIVLQDDKNMIE